MWHVLNVIQRIQKPPKWTRKISIYQTKALSGWARGGRGPPAASPATSRRPELLYISYGTRKIDMSWNFCPPRSTSIFFYLIFFSKSSYRCHSEKMLSHFLNVVNNFFQVGLIFQKKVGPTFQKKMLDRYFSKKLDKHFFKKLNSIFSKKNCTNIFQGNGDQYF